MAATEVVVHVDENATVCVKNTDDLGNSGPFQATQLWYRIISYLKAHANVKRRRFIIRQYDNCFSGENAVNVVYHCLMEERKSSLVITGEITRTKAQKVCQSLMSNGIFEAVGTKSRGSEFTCTAAFEDSSAKLYRFVEAGRSREVYSNKDPDVEKSSHSTSLEEEHLKRCGVVGVEGDAEPDEEVKENRTATVLRNSNNTSSPASSLKFLATPTRWSACVSPFRRLHSQSDDEWDVARSRRSYDDSDTPSTTVVADAVRARSESVSRARAFSRVLRAFGSSDLDSHGGCGGGRASPSSAKVDSPSRNRNSSKPNLLKFQRILSSSSTSLLGDEGSTSPTSSPTSTSEAPCFDEESVWKQVALSRLLTLIDLPFLDDILLSPKKKLPRPNGVAANGPAILDRHRLVRRFDSLPAYADNDSSSSSAVPWVSAAQQITDSRCFLLDNPIHMSAVDLKRRAFDNVLRYHTNLPSPILPSTLHGVFVAVLVIVKEGRFAVAVHALQMAVLLLPWQQRRELQQLLDFMHLASNDVTVRLKKQLTNRQLLLQQFTPLIIRHELLADDQAAILVSFLLHNRRLVFTTPEEVKREVDAILTQARLDSDAVSKSGINFCNRNGEESCEKDASSRRALEDLLNLVVDSVHMTLRDKEKWIKRFRKCHPDVYEKCFRKK